MYSTSDVLIMAGCVYIATHISSVYWYRNFPNRRFVLIKNRLLFNILGDSRGERHTDVVNPKFYPHPKITLTGVILYFFNTLLLISVFIFPNIRSFYLSYTIIYSVFIILILWPLEFIVYKIYKRTLPQQISFVDEHKQAHNDKTTCKSIYKYSNEILIDKEKQYYIFVEDTINFEKIGLLKITKLGEVIDITYKSRKEIDQMWKTHTRFYCYFRDRIKK